VSGQRFESHPVGDSGGSGDEVFLGLPGPQRSQEQILTGEESFRFAVGDEQPLHAEQRVSDHESIENVPDNPSSQIR